MIDVEDALLDSMRRGAWVDLATHLYEQGAEPTDADWQGHVSVAGDLLARLMTTQSMHEGTPRFLALSGAHILGSIDLEGADLLCPLVLRDCTLEDILLDRAKGSAVNIVDSSLRGFYGRRLIAEYGISLTNVRCAKEVNLSSSQLGQLTLSGGNYGQAPYLEGVRLDGAQVSRNVSFQNSVQINGELLLTSAKLGGQLQLYNGRFYNPGAIAISADGAEIQAGVFSTAGLECHGEARFVDAVVRGPVEFAGASFHNPMGNAILANGIQVSAGIHFTSGFSAEGAVSLTGAKISGQLIFADGSFRNCGGEAIAAHQIEVGSGVYFERGFAAFGRVGFTSAKIKAALNLSGGHFSNAGGVCITLNGMQLEGVLTCEDGFQAAGEFSLISARISGHISLQGGTFTNADDDAISADRLDVAHSLYIGRSRVNGMLRLIGAHIGGSLDLYSSKFLGHLTPTINAYGAHVDGGIFLRDGTESTEVMRFQAVHVNGDFICRGIRLGGARYCLDLEGASVDGVLEWRPIALPSGAVDLRGAKVAILYDELDTWPDRLELKDFEYGGFSRLRRERWSVCNRLAWLDKDGEEFHPSSYNQLAKVYRSSGDSSSARQVLEAKHRLAAKLNRDFRPLPGRYLRNFGLWVRRVLLGAGDWLVRSTVGYGFYPMRILYWLASSLIVSTYIFHDLYPDDIKTGSSRSPQPEFNSFLYSLDLLLPVAGIRSRDSFVAYDAAVWWSAGFTLVGWLLAAVLVAGLGGVFKRD